MKDLVYDRDAKVEITKEFTFDSCHSLLEYEGDCKRLHGHTYRLQVSAEGVSNEIGMVIDFKDLKDIVKKKVIKKLDHYNLNDVLDMNTTAENMVKWIYDEINADVVKTTDERVRVTKIRLWETPTSYATYKAKSCKCPSR